MRIDGAVAHQMVFEGVDVVVAVAPELPIVLPCGQRLVIEPVLVDLHDQHVFVVRAVEDADAAALGQALHAAPQEGVIELLGARLLEAEDLTALRVDAGHHVADGAVLAGGIHRLEHDQHRVAVVGVEQLLRLRQLLPAQRQQVGGALLHGRLAEPLELGDVRPRRAVVADVDCPARRHQQFLENPLVDHEGALQTGTDRRVVRDA